MTIVAFLYRILLILLWSFFPITSGVINVIRRVCYDVKKEANLNGKLEEDYNGDWNNPSCKT
jgi:hypothetical protein